MRTYAISLVSKETFKVKADLYLINDGFIHFYSLTIIPNPNPVVMEYQNHTLTSSYNVNRVDFVALQNEELVSGIEDWQPIESAPIDGTEVTLLYKTASGTAAGCGNFYYEEGDWMAIDISGDKPAFCIEPTHWKPIK